MVYSTTTTDVSYGHLKIGPKAKYQHKWPVFDLLYQGGCNSSRGRSRAQTKLSANVERMNRI